MFLHIRSSRRAFTFLSVVALGFSSSSAAQAPLPVYVGFEFQEPSLAGKLSDATRATKQKEMSARLAAKLLSRFPFWSFKNGAATDYPRLNLWLEKHSKDEWQMQL